MVSTSHCHKLSLAISILLLALVAGLAFGVVGDGQAVLADQPGQFDQIGPDPSAQAEYGEAMPEMKEFDTTKPLEYGELDPLGEPLMPNLE